MTITNFNLADLDGSNGFRIAVAEEYSFRSTSNAGDVNGDGLDDVSFGILGDSSKNYSVSGYVVFGKVAGFDAEIDLSEFDGSDGFRLEGGWSFSAAGDVNGDGFDDVITGSYVVFGKAAGFDAGMDLSELDGSDGFRLEGGSRFSTAGDVNGDGFDDVIIGDPGAGLSSISGNFYSGSSYVLFGKASGFDAVMDVFGLDGSNGFRMDGTDKLEGSGSFVSTAGDVNGDGFDDVIIGTNSVSNGTYVVFGKASGFNATMNLSSLDGSNGFRLSGAGTVSAAGDVNDDGFDDVIIGSENYSSYVVFGRASGFGTWVDLSKLNGKNGFRVDTLAPRDGFGSSVSAAGDVNGDGFDDVIIGAPGGSGSSYVVFGQASGFDNTVNLMSLNGVSEDIRLGSSVSGVGDANGDGLDDLMIGAGGNIEYRGISDLPHYSASSGYVVFGSSDFTGLAAYLGTSGGDTLTGTPAAEIFYARDGKDTLIGGGGADTIFGGTGRDIIRVLDSDFLLVDGGNDYSGFVEDDTLELDGGGMNLDLTAANHKVIDIETIDLSGTGDNVLTLTAANVLDLSSSTDTLTVKGDAGDRVAGLSSGWVDRGFKGEFHMFSAQNEAVLMVADAVSTDFVNGGHRVISDLNGDNGFRLDGAAYDYSGGSVSNAGDINGDGFDDVIIGAPFADSNGINSGSSYVVFGKVSGFDPRMNLSGLDGSNGFRLNGVANNDSSGVVSSAGDVNGDGFDDVIIGAPGADNNDLSSGSSYIVFGKASGFDATMNLSGLDGSNGFRLDGELVRDYSGRSVSNAGDVNGDGFDDVIIGVPGADPNNSNFDDEGSSYVVFGKASGFDAAMNLSTLDGSNGFRLDGESFSGQAGTSVSTAGDVNGDGFDDVIIGTGNSSYVVFGKAVGFDAAMSLSDLNGSNGFRMKGGAYDHLDKSVNAGDVNGDGFDDLIISTRGARVGDYYYGYSYTRGGSYVVFGKASGFDAVMDLSKLDGSNGFRLNEERDYADVSVSGAGDVNGDGFDDLIIADPDEQDRTFGNAGPSSSYVMFGKASGFDAVADLSDLSGDEGFRLDGIAKKGILVTSVSGAGDVNGDGFDDLIAGAPSADLKGKNSGSSYVIFGRSDFTGGDEVDFPGTPGDDNFTGTQAEERFEGGAGDDRMIGRGGADWFDGGSGNDYIRISDDSFEWADGGAGTDILGLAGSGFNLDLSSVIDNIHSIETISLYGIGDNSLTLTAQDVLDLSDTTNTLKVKGNAGDSVVGLNSGWTDGGVHGNFHTYTQDDAVLLIGVDVTTDFPVG